ncbi:2-dehydropantoate 2-reductase [Bowdeniella nasicola]|uniref:2-dehydropantoate 2-reductase n=1 Tax=Bowdeniella nasicola TaxID=208480 RepID=A0A1Q5Q0J7_9ACTO|nr:2-dehydropantoate 2-reductase [Bowdeniella nasicola]OKL53266.1 2-dehydropantoate 2-reductase [Bowdeniella nasicola]
MKLLIVGAGAMGLYFAARLTQAGHDVTILTRPGTTPATSIRLARGEQVGTISPIRVLDRVPDAGLAPDAVLIATKAWQVEAALGRLAGRIPRTSAIITVQNGIEAPEIARGLFPDNPVIAGTCVVHVLHPEPFSVELLGSDATLTLGYFDAIAADATRLADLISEIDASPIVCTRAEDIHRALWKKLALIASYGGIGAAAHATVGQTRDTSETRTLVRTAIREAADVARAHAVTFTDADEEEVMAIYTEHFAADATSSMQRDLAAGAPSELANQNGVIVARAAKLGIPVPTHSFIYRTQLPRERSARARE